MLKKISLFVLAALAAISLRAASTQDSLINTITSDSSVQAKWTAAHQLAGIATVDAVPRLAPLLTNEQFSDLARCVLEPMPSPAAAQALRNALASSKGHALEGIIASLGARRDAKAVPLLAGYLQDPDTELVNVTLAALGRIGAVPAAKAIERSISPVPGDVRPQFWEALIECAETLSEKGDRAASAAAFAWVNSKQAPSWIHAAAVRGVILTGGNKSARLAAQYLQTDTATVLRLVQSDLPGAATSAALAAELPKLSTEKRILLIEALGQRGDATAVAALIREARNGEKTVRLAAIRNAPHDVSLVPALVELISDPDEEISQAASDRLAALPELQAGDAIVKLFDSESPTLRSAAVRMAGLRRLHRATPALVQAAASADSHLAAAALTALGETANETDMDELCGLLARPGIDLDAVESILAAIGGRSVDSDVYVKRITGAFSQSTTPAKCVLLRVLGDLGGAKALQVVRNAATSSDPDVKQTAIRILAKWPGAALQPPSAKMAPNAFFPFCIDWHDAKKRNYTEQAAMLKELGYDGVGHIYLDGVAERLKTLDAAGLKLFQITMTVDLTEGKAPYDARFKDVLALVKGRHVQFDLLCNGGRPSDASLDARAVKLLRQMSDLARESGAQLLLYPHVGCWVERIEDATRVAEKVDRPNVGVMFNLCHWLRADNTRDYKSLLAQAMPKLWAVSICGADDFDPAPGWAHYIQPLDRGSFDMGQLLKTLRDLGYTGPIGLQCYGIGGDAREHLARSFAAWQKLKVNLQKPGITLQR